MGKLIMLPFLLSIAIQIQAQLPSFSEDCPEYMYFGMDNMIPLNLNGVDVERVSFKASKANRVSKYSDSLYAVYPATMEGESVIKLYYKNIIVQQKVLKVLPLLQLHITIGNEGSGLIKKSDLILASEFEIKAFNSESPINLTFRLISSGINIFDQKGQILYSNTLRESKFSEDIKEIFKKLPTGARLVISNPRVINNYNQTVQIEPYKEWIIVE